jgi:DNA (cytosine-5)-methyltransferase 1
MGYYQAGFDVVGVDINPQPRYPFAFIQHDALTLDMRFIRSFDVIHASPPCQGYSAMRHAPGTKGAPRLIVATADMLDRSGVEWVIENVEAAKAEMPGAIRLCGTSFGLGAHGCDLHRHRLFKSSVSLRAPGCQHGERPVVGIYGGHARIRSARHGGRGTRDAWPAGHKPIAAEAMGMDWASLAEMSEAIPPAYTRFIGEQLIAHLSRRAAA